MIGRCPQTFLLYPDVPELQGDNEIPWELAIQPLSPTVGPIAVGTLQVTLQLEVSGFSLCVCGYTVWYPQGPAGGISPLQPESGVCKPPRGCWGLNLGPQQSSKCS